MPPPCGQMFCFIYKAANIKMISDYRVDLLQNHKGKMLMARFTTKSKMLVKEMIILTMLLWDILPMKILILGVYLNWLDFGFALQRSPV